MLLSDYHSSVAEHLAELAGHYDKPIAILAKWWREYCDRCERFYRSPSLLGFEQEELRITACDEDLVADGGMAAVDDFALANDPPRRRPRQFDDQPNTRQRNLVDGRGDLPGQLDLFD
jgi:hypothetical protein